MDFKLFGLLDIIIIVLAIVSLICGYKKGLMKKMLSFISIISIIIFSFFHCAQLAQVFIHNGFIYPQIYDKLKSSIDTYIATKEYTEFTTSEILKDGLNFPGFMANFFANGIGNPSAENLAYEIANYVSTAVMNIIAFVVIVIGILILLGLLNGIANALRNNTMVRVVDGILGMVLYAAIYVIGVSLVFYILSLMMDQSWFNSAREWLEVDMKLNDPDAFRLSKAIYNGNMITLIFNILF